MKKPRHVPEQIDHSNNGNGSVSTQPSAIDQKTSNYVDSQRENRGRILHAIPAVMDFKKATIRELLEYCLRTEDEFGWTEFCLRARPVIRGRCATRLNRRNDELLNELEQDAMAKLFANDRRRLREFKWIDDNSIFKYLRVVAATVVIDHWRKNSREIFLDDEDLDLISKHGAGHQTAEMEILRAEIDDWLRSFASERDRQIFWLFYRWGFTAKQIANLPTINLPVRKVENILQGLVRRIRDKLRESKKGASPD